MSDERLDLWLDAAGFEDLDAPDPTGLANVPGGEPDAGDDPWASFDVEPAQLTDAQRQFVDATSAGLGATLASGTLLATQPLDELDDDEVEIADRDVLEFDDDA